MNYDGYSDITFRPGIWYVMPVTRADHMQFVGGIANKSVIETHLFYRNLMDDIYGTYGSGQPEEQPFRSRTWRTAAGAIRISGSSMKPA